MTLQTTGAISLSNIQTEFGGSSPISMSEYYRGGAVYAAGNITAYSDERLKTNWRSIGEGFIFRLAGVKSGVYDRLDMDETQVGVSAQSLREVLPDAVRECDDGTLAVVYGNAALVACIELAKEVVALRAEIEALKARG